MKREADRRTGGDTYALTLNTYASVGWVVAGGWTAVNGYSG